jgi:hypothetical protein
VDEYAEHYHNNPNDEIYEDDDFDIEAVAKAIETGSWEDVVQWSKK